MRRYLSGFSCSSKAFKSYGTQKYLTKVKKVTAVAAGVPWRLVRPMLRDDGRVLRLGYAVLHTTTIYPGQGTDGMTDGEGRPSLGSALTYAHSVLHGHAPWTLHGGSDGQLTCTCTYM